MQGRCCDNPCVTVEIIDRSTCTRTIVADYDSLSAYKRLNGIGGFDLTFLDGQVDERFLRRWNRLRVLYSCPENGINNLNIFDGFLEGRRKIPATSSDVGTTTWYGSSLNRLLIGDIAYAEDTDFACKDGPADRVIAEYVQENIGNAIHSTRGGGNGCNAGQKISDIKFTRRDGNPPPNWEGCRADRSLYETISDIGAANGVDFEVVGDDCNEFQLCLYSPQLGRDRTGGRDYLELSECLQNLFIRSFEENSSEEASVIHVIGGEDANGNEVRYSKCCDNFNENDAICNTEVTVSDSQQTTEAQAESLACEQCAEYATKLSVSFDLPDCSLLYGRDLNLGDKFFFVGCGREFTYRLIEAGFDIQNGAFCWQPFTYGALVT